MSDEWLVMSQLSSSLVIRNYNTYRITKILTV
jgi:hypothetical protein